MHTFEFSIFRKNDKTDIGEEMENKQNGIYHSLKTNTLSKTAINLNGSRKIPKVSLRLKKIGRDIDNVSQNCLDI